MAAKREKVKSINPEEFKTYRDIVAHAQANNFFQDEGIRLRAVEAAKFRLRANQWHEGESTEGIKQPINDGDYIVENQNPDTHESLGKFFKSEKDWFEMTYEVVPEGEE